MKKSLWCFLIGILLLALLWMAAAADSGRLADQDQVRFSDEFQSVRSALQKAEGLPLAPGEQFDYENAYKVYEFAEPDIITQFQKQGSIQGILSDTFTWYVPTSAQNLAYVRRAEDGWEVLRFQKQNISDALAQSAIVDKATLSRTLSQKLRGAAELRYVVSNRYHTTFAYIRSEDGEYLVPYGSRPDLTGLANGTVYKADEAIDILRENFGEEPASGDADGGPGVSLGGKPGWVLLGCVCIGGMVCAAVCFIKKKRQKA